jgi:ParB family chromosome partitioning protein
VTNAKNLGKGLDALFGDINPKIDSLKYGNDEVVQVGVNDIKPNPDQPRKHFDESAISELSSSIKEFGVLQPLVVTKNDNDGYMIIAGERRWRAAKQAGLLKVPVIIRSSSELEKLEIGLIENVQREDLTPLEQAVSIERLHDQFSMSYTAIAAKLGKAYSTVANLVRLLQLPESMQNSLQKGDITEGHARALLALQEMPTQQNALFQLMLEKSISVRQAEQFVTSVKEGKDTKKAIIKTVNKETPFTKQLTKKYGVSVSVNYTARGGKISFSFKSEDDMNKLVDKFLKS